MATRTTTIGPAPEQGERASVYVIEAENTVKIGHSRNIHLRVKNLQTAATTRLRLVYQKSFHVIDAMAVERKAHALLSGARARGEWFSCSPDMAARVIRASWEAVKRGDWTNKRESQPNRSDGAARLFAAGLIDEDDYQTALELRRLFKRAGHDAWGARHYEHILSGPAVNEVSAAVLEAYGCVVGRAFSSVILGGEAFSRIRAARGARCTEASAFSPALKIAAAILDARRTTRCA